MIRIHTYNAEKGFEEFTDPDALPTLLTAEDAVVWARLENPNEGELDAFADRLDLHPLAEQALHEPSERPRLRRYGSYLSIIFMAYKKDPAEEVGFRFVKMNIIAGPHFVATVVHEPLPELEEAFTAWKAVVPNLGEDAAGPLYAILDTVIDDYFPVIDDLAEQVDTVEDDIVEGHSGAPLALIFTLKKAMLEFRRVASGARDVVNVLLRHDQLFGPASTVYFQDLFDNTVRITDSVDIYRDLLSNAMESYLNVTNNLLAETSNQMNLVMKTLTSWSIILGSATLITGVYGMNVEGLPMASRSWGFFFTAGIGLILAAALFALFRHKDWI